MVVVTFDEADVCVVVDPWETVLLDVWLVVVISGGRLVLVSLIVLGVFWEVSGDSDNDVFSEVTEVILGCMVVEFVVVAVFAADEVTSVFVIVDDVVVDLAFLVETVTG